MYNYLKYLIFCKLKIFILISHNTFMSLNTLIFVIVLYHWMPAFNVSLIILSFFLLKKKKSSRWFKILTIILSWVLSLQLSFTHLFWNSPLCKTKQNHMGLVTLGWSVQWAILAPVTTYLTFSANIISIYRPPQVLCLTVY